MSAVAAPSAVTGTASALRRLYFVRFAFAIVWALVMFMMAEEISPVLGLRDLSDQLACLCDELFVTRP